jgi:hypothetical protein
MGKKEYKTGLDEALHLLPTRPPADAVARQARPGFKAGNPGIDAFYDDRRKNLGGNLPKIPPSTKLEDLIAYYGDIKAQENLAFIRIECGSDKSEIFQYLQEKRREIDKRYEQFLNPQDCYSFKGLDELLNFLRSINLFTKKEIIKSLNHEKKHADEARKRGYDLNAYKCWLYLNKEKKTDYFLVTQIKTLELPPEKDYRAITAAPQDQSIIDMLSVQIPPMKKQKIGFE